MKSNTPQQEHEDYARAARVLARFQEAAAASITAELDVLRASSDQQRIATLQAAAGRVRAIDIDAMLKADLQHPLAGEKEAFEEAAKTALLNLSQGSDGGYLHPITRRMRGLWRTAIGWTLSSANSVGTPDALHPEYVVPGDRRARPGRRLDEQPSAERAPLEWDQGNPDGSEA